MASILKVLLLEELREETGLVKKLLTGYSSNYNLYTSTLGPQSFPLYREEFEMLDKSKPNLILFDIQTLGETVKALIIMIKADPRYCFVPLIVLAASMVDAQIKEAYNVEANCFIGKAKDEEIARKNMNSALHYWLNVVKLPGLYV